MTKHEGRMKKGSGQGNATNATTGTNGEAHGWELACEICEHQWASDAMTDEELQAAIGASALVCPECGCHNVVEA